MNSTAMKCVVTITSLGHITMSIYIPSLHNLSIIVRIDVCSNDDKKFRQISVVSAQIAPLIILYLFYRSISEKTTYLDLPLNLFQHNFHSLV